jgi:2'-5' RNA ligase
MVEAMELPFPLRSGFLALPLEGEAGGAFRACQASLAFLNDGHEPIVGWQKPTVPHLTLAYFPTIMAIEYGQITAQAAKIAASLRPFTVQIESVDTFGKPGRDEVLFLKPNFSPELAEAKKKCPWPSPYPEFHPHVTLARVKHPERFEIQKKAVLKAVKGVSFAAPFDRLRLYANVGGESQVPLADFPFGA